MTAIVTNISAFTDYIDKSKKEIAKLVDTAVLVTAESVRKDAVLSINKQVRGSKRSKRGANFHYPSPEGEAPNTDTGRLVGSIAVSHERNSQEAMVFSDLDYAAWLEFVLNRPWLAPATIGKEEELQALIEDYMKRVL
jgi:hypothetical protein